jgi:hypothetical protein
MPKFDQLARRPATTGPIGTTGEQTATAEGGTGWVRDVKSELFLLAVTNLVSEDTFYESGKQRDNRFAALVHQATREDPDWTARLIRWLRADANMRSASVVAAAEYAKAGGPNPRAVVASALQRADEPGEFIAYWHAKYGRTLAGGKQRGVADAVARLYTERAALKYDGTSHAYRLGDVVELVHPTPTAPWQADLFRYLIDRRHNRDEPRITDRLETIQMRAGLEKMPVDQRRAMLSMPSADLTFQMAGMTWESLSGWLQGPMDRQAWEAVIPSMGYMALLRNLRNFDEQGVSDEVAQKVAAKLADPAEVAKSRQFPLRFLSAFKAAPSLRWSWPLEQAVQHSLANVPALPGRTLILVDLSGSMWSPLSARSELQRWEAAALFGFALALRAQSADTYVYGSSYQRIDPPMASSLLTLIGRMQGMGGTDTFGTLAHTYGGHDRVVILTDEQAHTPGFSSAFHYGYSNTVDPESILRQVQGPIITFNLAGYRAAHLEAGANRVTVGGLTDQGFRMLDLLDKRARGDWPF